MSSAPESRAHAEAPATLRFGIMCTGTTFPRWQAECIRHVLEVPGVEASLLIIDAESGAAEKKKSVLQSLTSDHLLWNAYNRLCVRGKLSTEERVSLEGVLVGVPSMHCKTEKVGKYARYFLPEDVLAIREHRLDFILRFAFNIIRGEILSAAKYGVWSYHHDDLNKYRGPPACFWEIMFGDPVTGVTLQRLTEGIDNGVVLHKGWFKTVLKSYPRNREAAFAGSTGFPARVCRDILAGVADYADSAPSETRAKVYRVPGNEQTAKFVGCLALNKFKDTYGWLFRHDQWGIGIVDAPIHRFLEPGFAPEVRWLPAPPRDRIAADPFAVRGNHKTTIVYEELSYRDNKGRLVAVEASDDGGCSSPRIVLDLPMHLSYPFLIEHDGEVYCVPESSQASEVVLYRAAEFPWKWERVATLIAGQRVIDASLFQYEDRWWMLGAIKGPGGCIGLHGWHARHLRGPWIAHMCNPLRIDIRGARPGGTPFFHRGELFRPSQDLSMTYGGRIVIQRITRLNEREFKEHPSTIVSPRPDWPYNAGMHTLSSAGDQTVIDAKRLVFSPRLFARQAGKFLGLRGDA